MCKGLKLLQSFPLPDKLDSVEGILENLEHICDRILAEFSMKSSFQKTWSRLYRWSPNGPKKTLHLNQIMNEFLPYTNSRA
ncbi:unnamed protein product, partial [Vitis vinifera]|uniref:Uncharacterized protein n=1 Tax=Vitis vinifera TaxID=29760 RepID=D7SYM4_VITVI